MICVLLVYLSVVDGRLLYGRIFLMMVGLLYVAIEVSSWTWLLVKDSFCALLVKDSFCTWLLMKDSFCAFVICSPFALGIQSPPPCMSQFLVVFMLLQASECEDEMKLFLVGRRESLFL